MVRRKFYFRKIFIGHDIVSPRGEIMTITLSEGITRVCIELLSLWRGGIQMLHNGDDTTEDDDQ